MKISKKIGLFLAGIVMYCMMVGFSQPVFADNMNFSVIPVFPENQTDLAKSYYDLKMTPGEKETIEVKIINNTSEEITINAYANTALTNDNGVADYSQHDVEAFDETLNTPFSTIVTPDNDEITVPANESVMAKFTIDMPKEEYDGLILGGLHFQEKEKADSDDSEGSVQIRNRFSYVIGVSLRETAVEVATNLELLGVEPTQINYRNYVQATIRNTEAEIVRDLSLHAKIYTEKGNDILVESQDDGYKMVPNSSFNYGISWNNQRFKAGTYRLELAASADGNEYNWTDYFTITADEAKKFNEQAVDLTESSSINLWLAIGLMIVSILLLVVLLVFFIKHKRK